MYANNYLADEIGVLEKKYLKFFRLKVFENIFNGNYLRRNLREELRHKTEVI